MTTTDRETRKKGQLADIRRLIASIDGALFQTQPADAFSLTKAQEVLALRRELLKARIAAENIATALGETRFSSAPSQETISEYREVE